MIHKVRKIEQLQEEVATWFLRPEKAASFGGQAGTGILAGAWQWHILPVIQLSKQMAQTYQADLAVVWLGALLHDIAKLDDIEPHDQIGAERASQILLERGFDQDMVNRVSQVVLTHRCRSHPPLTLEDKIVASADAMSHFVAPFYIWWAYYTDQDLSQLMEQNFKKIERDFTEKIFFDEQRESVRKQYEVLKGWFTKQ